MRMRRLGSKSRLLAWLAALTLTLTPIAAVASVGTTGQGFALIDAPSAPGNHNKSSEVTLMIQGSLGIQNAPISETLRQELMTDWLATGSSETEIYLLNPAAVAAIENSVATGELDPYLVPYAENQNNEKSGGCSDRVRTKTKDFNLDWQGLSINGPVGPFTGDLTLDADIQGDAAAVFQYRIKRFRFLFWCIPYWVKFDHVRAFGDATIGGDIGLTGSLSNTSDPWQWDYQIAKPDLGSLNFWIGPIYVHLGFNLPITAGVQVGVSASASVNYEAVGDATGNFDYTCDFGGCTGSSSFNLTDLGNPVGVTASIEGRADIRAHVDIAVRTYLYSEGFAYAQVGVRPQAYVDIWGYFGSTCGDVDCDQDPETLGALTADVDWQVFVTAKADAFVGGPWEWNDLWHTSRNHLVFWDFLGSAALDPMLHGPEAARPGTPTTYQARMRPCWPYEDYVNYQVEWDDGTVNTFSNPPDEYQDLIHLFWQEGTVPISLTAISDSHGRNLDNTTTRQIAISPFAPTDDPDCSAGGTGNGNNGNGGGDPVANWVCIDHANTGNPGWDVECSGSGSDGLQPYTYYWQYDDGNWYSGPSSQTFTCLDFNDPIRFKIRDSNGVWSDVLADACPGGIA